MSAQHLEGEGERADERERGREREREEERERGRERERDRKRERDPHTDGTLRERGAALSALLLALPLDTPF